MIDAAAKQPRGGDRRRPARPRGGQRPEAARHGRHRSCICMPWLMERQLDATAGGCCSKSLEARGMKFLICAHRDRSLPARTASRRCALKDGREFAADLVVMAVGIRPNTDARARRAACTATRGIVVNDTMQTYRPAHLRGRRVRQPSRHRLRPGGAAVRAWRRSAQPPGAVRHRPLPRLGDLHQAQGHRHRPVLGRRLRGGDGTEEIVLPIRRRRLQEARHPDDKLVGACLYGDTVDGSWYFKLLRDGTPSPTIRDR